jgi:hypothetical protein
MSCAQSRSVCSQSCCTIDGLPVIKGVLVAKVVVDVDVGTDVVVVCVVVTVVDVEVVIADVVTVEVVSAYVVNVEVVSADVVNEDVLEVEAGVVDDMVVVGVELVVVFIIAMEFGFEIAKNVIFVLWKLHNLINLL